MSQINRPNLRLYQQLSQPWPTEKKQTNDPDQPPADGPSSETFTREGYSTYSTTSTTTPVIGVTTPRT
jgi:hypothetical protein